MKDILSACNASMGAVSGHEPFQQIVSTVDGFWLDFFGNLGYLGPTQETALVTAKLGDWFIPDRDGSFTELVKDKFSVRVWDHPKKYLDPQREVESELRYKMNLEQVNKRLFAPVQMESELLAGCDAGEPISDEEFKEIQESPASKVTKPKHVELLTYWSRRDQPRLFGSIGLLSFATVLITAHFCTLFGWVGLAYALPTTTLLMVALLPVILADTKSSWRRWAGHYIKTDKGFMAAHLSVTDTGHSLQIEPAKYPDPNTRKNRTQWHASNAATVRVADLIMCEETQELWNLKLFPDFPPGHSGPNVPLDYVLRLVGDRGRVVLSSLLFPD